MANKDELVQAARNPWWQAIAAVAAIALVATFALGGFRQAKSVTKPLPKYQAGHRYQGGAMAITPLRAWVARYKPGGQIDAFNPDKAYLVLQAEIENRTPRSFSGFGYPIKDVILVAAGGRPVPADTLMFSDDHTLVSDLHPRLKQRVDLVWPLPKGYVHSPKATFGVFARDYKAKAYPNDEGAWVQGNPAAKFEVPVQDLRNRMVAP